MCWVGIADIRQDYKEIKMKDQLFAIFESAGKLTTQQVAVNIIMAAVLGLLIYISYAVTHNGTIYSKKFNASLVVLATLTGTVMTVIGNNIALSLKHSPFTDTFTFYNAKFINNTTDIINYTDCTMDVSEAIFE